MIKTKDIEIFVKDLKSVKEKELKYLEENNCENCPLSSYNKDVKKRKYSSILNNASGFCSYWFREISGISTVGKGCAKTLEEVIRYFSKMLPNSAENKNKI